MDMYSGGGTKEPPYQYVYIQAPESEARRVFYNRFGHSPDRVSCTCCGADYSVDEHVSLEQATGFERGCRTLVTPRNPKTGLFQNDDPVIKAHLYLEDGEDPPKGYQVDDRWPRYKEYQPLEEYLKQEDVLVIRKEEIKPSERKGDLPEQGYVWVD